MRTHMLVSVGSYLLMIVSAYGFRYAIRMPHVVLDPLQIAAWAPAFAGNNCSA